MRDAGTQCYHTIPSKLSRILGIVVLMIVLVCVGYIQVQYYKQAEDYCNNQYGVNNWEFTEIIIYNFYVGLSRECVPLSNSSSDKSESFNKD